MIIGTVQDSKPINEQITKEEISETPYAKKGEGCMCWRRDVVGGRSAEVLYMGDSPKWLQQLSATSRPAEASTLPMDRVTPQGLP